MIGFMGSGKSYHGRKLRDATNWDFLDLDEFIVDKHLLSINEVFAREGESYFRELEHLALKDVLKRVQPTIVATGGGTPCFFNQMDLMNNTGYTFYLNNPLEKITAQLISGQHKRPLLKGKSEEELRGYVEQKLAERSNFYEQATWTIECFPGRQPVEEIIKILKTTGCLS